MELIAKKYMSLNMCTEEALEEFYECVGDLVQNEDVLKLDTFKQHLETSRLQHSYNVAFLSFCISKRLGLDFKSAARAGILHDLFLYDWRLEKQEEGAHAFAHPKVALRNASRIAELNNIEKDAIAKHMWPLCGKLPKYKETLVVSMADKYCACAEVVSHVASKVRNKRRERALAQ